MDNNLRVNTDITPKKFEKSKKTEISGKSDDDSISNRSGYGSDKYVICRQCHPCIGGKTYKITYKNKTGTIISCPICANIYNNLENLEYTKSKRSSSPDSNISSNESIASTATAASTSMSNADITRNSARICGINDFVDLEVGI